MRKIKFRMYWQHQESDCFGYDYFDACDGWKQSDPCQEPVALEQYTGLKDKNGKEIYDGDILDGGIDGTCVVFWHEPTLSWCYECDHAGALALFPMTVIGNIHENPELLK